MSLQDRLDAHRKESEAKTPPEVLAVIHRAIDDLARSGAPSRARKVGDQAPGFSLKDPDGQLVTLADLLAKGPLVVSFYRGAWCPYCNLDLQALRDILPDIAARGANLVAISPQNAVNSRRIQRQHSLNFPVLSDPGAKIAEAYGVRWRMPDDLVAVYKDTFKLDLALFNEEDSWALPMPGRFIIDPAGTIACAEVNADYMVRPDPSELLPVLDRLAQRAA